MALLTLPEARAFLNFEDEDATRDEVLQEYIDGVTAVVEREVGPIEVRQVTVTATGDGRTCALPVSNIISIDEVVDQRTGLTVDHVGIVVGAGSVLWSPTGVSLVGRDLQVKVTVGMGDDVPPNLKLAAVEILKLAWAVQRSDEAPAFLIPYRAQALLAPSIPGERMVGFA